MAERNITRNIDNIRLPFLDLTHFVPIGYAVPVYGYLFPIVICLTVFTNIFACVVLLQKNMRSSTSILFTGMAIADLCTGIFPLTLYIYFFSLGNYLEKVSVNWCVIYVYFGEYIPAIFHTTSIWLTTTLAIQRYMFVYRSLNVRIREKCTMRKIVIVIVIIFDMAILSHFPRFLEDNFSPVNAPSNIHPNDTIKTCAITVNPWLLDNFKIYYNLYFWFRAIFIHLIPCLILLFINVLLIIKIRKAYNRRRQMTSQHRIKDLNSRTNLMLVIVVGIFLVAELPFFIIIILHVFQNSLEHISFLSNKEYAVISLLTNSFLLLSFPLNFFIYCGMSKQFRETLKKIIKCNYSRKDRQDQTGNDTDSTRVKTIIVS